MKIFIIIILFASLCFGIRPDYFQQHVAYEIEVILDDSAHTLQAFEKIVYTNNSLDTLDFIWFHIWPNAYKNTETAFAKQRERFLNTSFIFSEEKKRGYIDSLDFKIDGVETTWEFHPDWIDIAKVRLTKSLPPDDVITIETPFFVKLPRCFHDWVIRVNIMKLPSGIPSRQYMIIWAGIPCPIWIWVNSTANSAALM